uniref:Putative secreted peptide n=1 Tax=Anopheles braziliensis TaxID=58242 RepID=A0A2M3ZMA9_9DIPT
MVHANRGRLHGRTGRLLLLLLLLLRLWLQLVLLASLQMGETLAETDQKLVGIVARKHHRWLQLDHVVVRPIAAHQYPVDRLHALHHGFGGARGRHPPLPVTHQLDADKQAGTAHIAHQLVLGRQRPALVEQVAADQQRILLQPLLVDHAHHRVGDRARHRITTVRVEVADAGRGETLGDLGRRHDGPDRVPVPHRFGDRHDVRDDLVRLERPVVRTDAPKPDLHLVRDRHTAGRPDRLVDAAEVVGRWNNLATAALQALRDEGGHTGRAALEQPLHLAGVQLAQIRPGRVVAVPVLTPVHIRARCHMDKVWLGVTARLVELVRRDVHHGGHVPMVGVVERDDLVAAGMLASEPERQIVRLRARVDEVAHRQPARHLFRERPGTQDELVVQEAIVGRERGQLALARLHYLRVTVSHVGDVVDAVEVPGTLLVVHVLALAAHYLQRIGPVEQLAGLADVLVAQRDGVRLGHILACIHFLGRSVGRSVVR